MPVPGDRGETCQHYLVQYAPGTRDLRQWHTLRTKEPRQVSLRRSVQK